MKYVYLLWAEEFKICNMTLHIGLLRALEQGDLPNGETAIQACIWTESEMLRSHPCQPMMACVQEAIILLL